MNKITNEGPIMHETRHPMASGGGTTVRKLPDDPMCLRVSLGGTWKDGFYVAFRGDEFQIEQLLTEALRAFREHRKARGVEKQ